MYCVMKLQRRVNRRVENKEYLKWYVDISPDIIKQTGWKEGVSLNAVVKNGKIVLETTDN
jgi:hypothetical protein